MKTIRLFLILFLLQAGLSKSQEYYFDKIDEKDGLRSSYIRCAFQSNDGFLWFGSNSGLFRYDGYSCVEYKKIPFQENSLCDNTVTSITEDHLGRLWIGTLSGLSCLNRQKQKFINYYYDKQNNLLGSITDILYYEGYIFFTALTGFYRIDIETSHLIKIDNSQCHHIEIDSQGRIWFCNYEKGLQYSEQKYSAEQIKMVTYPYLKDQNLISIEIGKDSSIFALYRNKLIRISYPYFQSNSVETFYMPNSSKVNQDCYSFFEDSDSILWIGCWNGVYYQVKRNSTKNFHESMIINENILCDNVITGFYETSDRSIFVLTKNHHVYQHVKNKTVFQYYNIPLSGFPEKDVNRIIQRENNEYLVCAYNGIYQYFAEQDQFQILTDKIEDVYTCYLKDSLLFIGTIQKLEVLNLNTKSFYGDSLYDELKEKLHGRVVTDIIGTKSGDIWISSAGKGLFRISNNQLFSYCNNYDSLCVTNDYIWDLMEDDKGRIWVASDNGLNIIDMDKNTINSFFYESSDSSSISSNVMISLFQDRENRIWIGTFGGGLNLYLPETNSFLHWQEKDGLSHNNIVGITQDSNGLFWVSTDFGLNSFEFDREFFRHYFAVDGLRSNTFNFNSISAICGNRIFLGGNQGLISFYPDSIRMNSHVPSVHISKIYKMNQSQNIIHNEKTGIVLHLYPKDHYFSIDYVALDYQSPSRNQYKYILEGFHHDWIDAGNVRSVSFSNLQGGEYVFKVMGSNNSGVWNPEPAQLRIVVHPPFWETAFFRIFSLIFIIFLVVSIAYYRMRQIKKVNVKLEEMVSLRTKDLKAKNSRILLYYHLLKSLNDELEMKPMILSIIHQLKQNNRINDCFALVSKRNNDGFALISEKQNMSSRSDFSVRELKLMNLHSSNHIKYVSYPSDYVRSLFYPYHLKHFLIFELDFSDQPAGYFFIIPKTDFPEEIQVLKDLLHDIKEIIRSVFIKTKMIDELSELNSIKNEFIGMAAHDLKNPLSIISNYASLLLHYLKQDDLQLDKINSIIIKVKSTVERMNYLIESVLDISSIEAGKIELKNELIDLYSIVNESVSLFNIKALEKNIHLSVSKPDFSTKVKGDSVRIREVIDNLISNGIKYTYPDGFVKLSFFVDGEYLVTSIADNGQGMSKDDLSYLFHDYRKVNTKPTAGEKSTGFGLVIAKKIIEVHNGYLWAESEKNQGSTFYFSLPME